MINKHGVTAVAMVAAIIFLVSLAAAASSPAPGAGMHGARLQAAFEENYQNFKLHCEKVKSSSLIEARLDSPYFQAIVSLGLPALPHIIAKLNDDPGFVWIAWAANDISRVIRSPSVYPWAAEERETAWWAGGQKLANGRFEWAYGQWKAAKAAGRADDADKFFRTMRAIGIAALPPMMDKISAGEAELLPIVQDLTSGAANTTGATPQERISTCAAWWNQSKTKWLIPFPDQAALAGAAPDAGSAASSSAGGVAAAPEDAVPFHPPATVALTSLGGHEAAWVRQVAESLGYEVSWSSANRSCAISNHDSVVARLAEATPIAQVNGNPAEINPAPVITDGKMYAPLDFLARTLGFEFATGADSGVAYIWPVAAPSEPSASADQPAANTAG